LNASTLDIETETANVDVDLSCVPCSYRIKVHKCTAKLVPRVKEQRSMVDGWVS
jgi:hypothetical protein